MAVSSSKGICGDIAGLAWLEDEGKEGKEEEKEEVEEEEERMAVEEEGE